MAKRLVLVGLTVAQPAAVAADYVSRAGLGGVSRAPFFVAAAPSSTAPGLGVLPLGWGPGGTLARRRGATQLFFLSDDVSADAEQARGLGCEVSIDAESTELSVARIDVLPLGLRLHLLQSPRIPTASELLEFLSRSMLGDKRTTDDEVTTTSGFAGVLDHMAIDVVDADRARQLVTSLLGYCTLEELAVPHPTGDARVRVMQDEDARFQIVLGDTDAGGAHPIARQIAAREGPGAHHVAHRVTSLPQAMEDVQRRGAHMIGSIREAPGLRQVFMRWADDGILHELIERTGVSGFVERNTASLLADGLEEANR